MISNPEYKLNLTKETLNLPDFEGFADTLRAAIAELSRRSPQDGFITVAVDRQGAGYSISIQLASSVLNFLEVGEGRSPFFALENVLLKAHEALRIWSINRKF